MRTIKSMCLGFALLTAGSTFAQHHPHHQWELLEGEYTFAEAAAGVCAERFGDDYRLPNRHDFSHHSHDLHNRYAYELKSWYLWTSDASYENDMSYAYHFNDRRNVELTKGTMIKVACVRRYSTCAHHHHHAIYQGDRSGQTWALPYAKGHAYEARDACRNLHHGFRLAKVSEVRDSWRDLMEGSIGHELTEYRYDASVWIQDWEHDYVQYNLERDELYFQTNRYHHHSFLCIRN